MSSLIAIPLFVVLWRKTSLDERKKIKLQQAAAILKNPVLWAKACVKTVDNATKQVVPWEARWYQKEMLLDNSIKKVARCGRRTGGTLPVPDKLLEYLAAHHKKRQGNQQRTLYYIRTFRD